MKNFSGKYFERVNNFEQCIFSHSSPDLAVIVVIPVFNEPNVDKTLLSLILNSFSGFSTEIIFVVNSSENSPNSAKKENLKSIDKLNSDFQENKNEKLGLHVLHFQDLEEKKSGVGVARKIGMDEALRRFISINNPQGIIVSLDADTIVEKNYLQSIFDTFNQNKNTQAANIYFEHPTNGYEFPDEIYKAITVYEIYLRYYIEALRYTGFPYAFHTIGSAFCCTAKIYAEQGGMVTNQSGEDFYFLQKIIPVSNFKEISTTTVYPSPRITDRVIFGTGVAVNQIINEYGFDFPTYKFEAFLNLKLLFEQLENLFESNIEISNLNLHKSLETFLISNKFKENLNEIKRNTKNYSNFKNRFFKWFNAFRIIKYLNFAHENYCQKSSAIAEASELLKLLNHKTPNETISLLNIYRKIQQ
ncbi:MAG: glycosyltransferase [Bacteroidales bacterium]|nr:glycosyltransferase [Bacteroidales bacterium]